MSSETVINKGEYSLANHASQKNDYSVVVKAISPDFQKQDTSTSKTGRPKSHIINRNSLNFKSEGAFPKTETKTESAQMSRTG